MKPIISTNLRIRHPDVFVVGEDSIVDDFGYFSTQVIVGRCSHIASSCTIAGGRERTFRLGDFSSLSAGVRVWCTSDDFAEDLIMIVPPDLEDPKKHLIAGDVSLGNYTGVGANTVIMPANEIPEGTAIGALSFVPPAFAFEPWSVYAGTPIRKLRARNRDAILRQVEAIERSLAARRTP